MSLERFVIKKNIFHPILAIGFINFMLTIALLMVSATVFARPSGMQMDFPSPETLTDGGGQEVLIMITAENVIYINGHVVTLTELRRFLAQGSFRRDSLMIRADRRASMGRLADILDLCRGIAGASVNVSTIL